MLEVRSDICLDLSVNSLTALFASVAIATALSFDSDRVVAGFMRLSEKEQNEVIEEIDNFNRKDSNGKKVLKEQFTERAAIHLGPTSTGGCPCCGK